MGRLLIFLALLPWAITGNSVALFQEQSLCVHLARGMMGQHLRPSGILKKKILHFLWRRMDSNSLVKNHGDNIENILQHWPVLFGHSLGENAPEGVALVVLSEKTKAIWKPWREDNPASDYRAEVLAYHMDKLLALGQVPPTVERSLGGEVGSLQLHKPLVRYDDLAPEAKARALEETRKQFLFDMIIANMDRFGDNMVYTTDGRAVSIDNGSAFVGHNFAQMALLFGQESLYETIPVTREEVWEKGLHIGALVKSDQGIVVHHYEGMRAVMAYREMAEEGNPLFFQMDMKSFLDSSEEAQRIIERLRRIDLRRLRGDVAAFLFSEERANALVKRIEKFIEYADRH